MRALFQNISIFASLNYVLFFPTYLHAKPNTDSTEVLSPKKVIALVEQRAIDTLDSRVRLLQSEFTLYQVDSNYKWKASAEYGFDRDRTPSASTSTLLQTDKYGSTATLSRNFLTGTLLSLQWIHADTTTQYNNGTPDNRYNLNTLLLTVEQLLYPNFLGANDRSYIEAAEKDLEAQRIQNQIDLEDQKVKALGLFWAAFNARATLEESRRTVQSYENLAQNVRRKNNYAFTAPGDLQQALIEFETRKQNLRDDEINFQKNLQALKDYLGFNLSTHIELQPENWEGFPKPFTGEVSNLKRFQYQKNKSLAATALKDAVEDKGSVQLSLVGKYGRAGLQPNFSDSIRDLDKQSQDRSYIGVKLSYVFDNDSARSEIELRKTQASLESTRLERKSVDLQEQIRIAYDKLNSSKENIQVTQTILELREKVVQQQNRTFSQGRTDISILIDSMNKLSTARLNVDRARADFQTTLLQYLYLTDQSEAQIVKSEIIPPKPRL